MTMYPEFYAGYRLRWTGWKKSYDQVHLFGQWFAIPEESDDPVRYFASTPGSQGFWMKGQILNTGRVVGQIELFNESDERCDQAVSECFGRLIAEIEKQDKPPFMTRRELCLPSLPTQSEDLSR